jgi:MFS family permease
MMGGSLLLALGCAIAWASLAGAGFTVLMLGLFAAGAGIALPFASSPQIGLAALPQTQAGQGSGMLNAFSFLGGTVGVTCGGIIFGVAGFASVLLLVALSALVGAALSLWLRAWRERKSSNDNCELTRMFLRGLPRGFSEEVHLGGRLRFS